MTGKMIIIIMTVMLAGGAPQQVKWSETYDSMRACEAAKPQVEAKYKREHPDAEIRKVECMKS